MIAKIDEKTALVTCNQCQRVLGSTSLDDSDKLRGITVKCYPSCDGFQFRHKHPSERPGYRLV